MIFDTMENCERYYGVNPNFEKGFNFIRKAVKENLPKGKYEINGKDVYASVQEYDTKPVENCKFEGHRNYIDIQFIISGTEIMDSADIYKAQLNSVYNDEKDVEFYAPVDNACRLVVEEGEYAIFMPNDIHRPGIAPNNVGAPTKKIVVKIRNV